MKNKIGKLIILFAAVVVFLTGCNKLKDFGNTNTNPAATNSPITSALLTNSLSQIGGFASITIPALYAQYFSETQYPEKSLYVANLATSMGTYSGILYDLQNIIKTNTDAATKDVASLNGANANQIAIARILKAYIFWTITDRWGDVPYSMALKGNPNVGYTPQDSIYKDLIKELTESVAQFTTGAPIKGDVVYGGDVTKWKKFANSLRMLMALNLVKQYPSASDYAATQFKAALADANGYISSNADNFQVAYPGGNFKNPFYNLYDGRKDYGESATMTTILGTFSDGRQAAFGATVSGAATTKGVPFGRVRTFIDPWCQANTDYAYVLAPSYRQATSPLNVVRAASIFLARAEAADKGWTTENTTTLFQAGINASFAEWGLTAPAASYFTQAGVALGAAGTNTQQIATQEWIAYYPDGLQGWSVWRRTNYPTLTPAPDATNSPKVVPRRYCYGTDDYNLTSAGVAAAVARLTGGDKQESKIWWDK
jgi:hypothetical protein